MNPLVLALLIGGGLYIYSQSQQKPTASKLDPGYKIIIPCKEFEIYNEKKSYDYAYSEFSKLIPKFLNYIKSGDEKMLKIFDDLNMKMFGCPNPQNDKDDINPVFLSPKYYIWGFKMMYASLKAFIDKIPLVSNISTNDAIIIANNIIT